MIRRGLLAALILGSALVLGGCRSAPADPTADIALDGSPREPDGEGIVEKVSLEEITIDGQTFGLSRNLLAFNTYTLEALPVLSTQGSYVQIGVKSDKVVWLAQVARVLTADGEPQAFYRGTLVAKEDRMLTFQDGTVLQASKDLPIPAVGSIVVADLDVRARVVKGFSPA